MSLLRFFARSMLASYFVINGLKTVRHPEDYLDAAQPVADAVLPTVNSVLPESVRSFVPEDTTALVKKLGIAQVIGGVGLATGIGRRAGAGVLAATMVPHVLASNPRHAKGSQRAVATSQLTKNIALLGGVLLAALDTEGRPDLAWKVRTRKALAAKEAAKRKAEVEKGARVAAVEAASTAKKQARKGRKAVADVLR